VEKRGEKRGGSYHEEEKKEPISRIVQTTGERNKKGKKEGNQADFTEQEEKKKKMPPWFLQKYQELKKKERGKRKGEKGHRREAYLFEVWKGKKREDAPQSPARFLKGSEKKKVKGQPFPSKPRKERRKETNLYSQMGQQETIKRGEEGEKRDLLASKKNVLSAREVAKEEKIGGDIFTFPATEGYQGKARNRQPSLGNVKNSMRTRKRKRKRKWEQQDPEGKEPAIFNTRKGDGRAKKGKKTSVSTSHLLIFPEEKKGEKKEGTPTATPATLLDSPKIESEGEKKVKKHV